MHNFLINFINEINNINENIFAPLHNFIDKLGLEHWLEHAIFDSLQMIPFLFIIFIFIELIEKKYISKVTTNLTNSSIKAGPILGSIFASLPQCGFSVIASTLYSKKYLTKGTLIAVYLATSDEAIPILLSSPNSIDLIIPILITKIFIGIVAGYAIDLLCSSTYITDNKEIVNNEEKISGCHNHDLTNSSKWEVITHPLLHTITVSIFILIVTIGINYTIHRLGGPTEMTKLLLSHSILQPVISAIIGLIPNCAISVGFTMLYMKGAISFGSVIAGLSSGAGLGLLVLFKRNTPLIDTIKIVLTLLVISMLSGIIIQFLFN